MHNPNIAIQDTALGKSLFASASIQKDDVIAVFDGQVYEAETSDDLPNESPLCVRDHAIQIETHKWIDSEGFGRYINHSCEPNCGIKDRVKIVAMRNIQKGEELTLDYDMMENSNWTMDCQCDTSSCRKTIRGYKYLPESKRKEYAGYISEWLL
jgi:hypothetical protein